MSTSSSKFKIVQGWLSFRQSQRTLLSVKGLIVSSQQAMPTECPMSSWLGSILSHSASPTPANRHEEAYLNLPLPLPLTIVINPTGTRPGEPWTKQALCMSCPYLEAENSFPQLGKHYFDDYDSFKPHFFRDFRLSQRNSTLFNTTFFLSIVFIIIAIYPRKYLFNFLHRALLFPDFP
jgi:hypothetical protein